MSQGIALLASMQANHRSKRARFPTTREEEPDVDEDSNSPFYDAYLPSQGAQGIMTLTNFTPSEFNLLWSDVRSTSYALERWFGTQV
ncbi:hypothetical protein DYB28_005785 [Aphanomyces astaci]|uniref:Uncharacterized protein n=1 Tax=Aphanomyces astaci TaxID=112090 RepID=A0A9X8H8E7_APHAT|nr:hypothetical protein DYB28_005785 [Aphanomyces astaci]